MPSFIKQYGSKGKDGTYSLSATDISVMTAVPTSGAVLGSVIAAYAGDRIGRKRTLYIGCLFSLIGAGIQTGSYNVATMTVGRLFASKCLNVRIEFKISLFLQTWLFSSSLLCLPLSRPK